VTLKDWAQLTFGLLNGLSFALTFRHAWRAKIIGSCALLIAHPGIAVYFLLTHQAFFLVNSWIMTSAGLYGLWRGLRMRHWERHDRFVATTMWKGYGDGERLLGDALRKVAEDVLAKRVDKTP
jgi:ABC-type nickel/cobalt efflux system permease component RcnA